MAKIDKAEAALIAARKRMAEVVADAQAALGVRALPEELHTTYRRVLDPKHVVAIEQAQLALQRAELEHLYGHKPGTPETYAKIEAVAPAGRQAPLSRMYENGEVTEEQWRASVEICAIAELIESAVGVRGASLEARVDNAAAARDVLIESLGRVRLERTYTAWRGRLPMPRRMYLDMVLSGRPLVAIARSYGEPWRKARKHMLASLDLWIEIKERTWKDIDEQDVNAVYARLGCGMLLPPKPRLGLVIEQEDDPE